MRHLLLTLNRLVRWLSPATKLDNLSVTPGTHTVEWRKRELVPTRCPLQENYG